MVKGSFRLSGVFGRFKPFKALVVGDFMLDTYTTGKVKRISPEAPVPVLQVEKQQSLPGGAGNVVLNLISLGAAVTAVGRVGDDIEGRALKSLLESENVHTDGLLVQTGYPTPVKNRLIAAAQQIIRVDRETIAPLPQEWEEAVLKKLPSLLESVQVVAISDYGKGFLSRHLLSEIIRLSKERDIPVIVDPKGADFSKYQRASIIKPNLSEAYAASKLAETEPLERVAAVLLKETQADRILITRSEEGISLFEKNGKRSDFPVRSREVKDVTGAGDTVLALISACLANGFDMSHAAQFANIAAGIAIERIGCARISLSELARRLLEYDTENKIFDENHLFALREALKGKKFSILVLKSTEGISPSLFHAIRELAIKEDHELILYVRDPKPDLEVVGFLSSLQEVDFLVLKKESLEHLCSEIHPERIFVLESGKVSELHQFVW
jgi:D-glycero-beta-D-manno-heptose-7-phosphate kinase